jgi:hypothetical protein
MCCRRCIPRRPGSNLDQHQHQDHIKTFSEISYNIYDEVYNQINYGKAEGSCTLGVRAPRTPGQHRPDTPLSVLSEHGGMFGVLGL